MDTAEFISRAKQVHGNKFNYDECQYVNARSKVTILCEVHGPFLQRPYSHLEGYGCKKCALEDLARKKRQSRTEAVCPTCGKSFSFPPSEQKKGRKYCSEKCSREFKRTKPSICVSCGATFVPKKSRSKFCSTSCTGKSNQLSQSQILSRFEQKYGDRFDYSNSKYFGMHKPIKASCSLHGNFECTPLQHLQGKYCGKCKDVEKLLVQKFSQNIPAEILSDEERSVIAFHQHWNNLNQCKNCAGNFFFKKSRNSDFCSKKCSSVFYGKLKSETFRDSEDFIPPKSTVQKKVELLYGSKITVLKIIPGKTIRHHKIEADCSRHGRFVITLDALANGADCHFCTNRLINRQRFLERVKETPSILKKEYDYSKVPDFEDGDEKQTIICPKHGEFRQTPRRHLAGDGCRECAIEKRAALNLGRAKGNWPENAITIHGDAYDYSSSIYAGAREYTEIICPFHGPFFQRPNNHLNGAGCPDCGEEKRSLGDTILTLQRDGREIAGRLYLLECLGEDEHFFKIGITSKTVAERYPTEISMPYQYSVMIDIEIGLIEAFLHEQRILKSLCEYSYSPSTYFAGETECLSVNPCEFDDELNFYLNSEHNIGRSEIQNI